MPKADDVQIHWCTLQIGPNEADVLNYRMWQNYDLRIVTNAQRWSEVQVWSAVGTQSAVDEFANRMRRARSRDARGT